MVRLEARKYTIMKILKWRIYRSSRIEKIASMISGIKEDQELAKSLLLGEQKESNNQWPRYRIEVEARDLKLQKQKSPSGSWDLIDRDFYSKEDMKAAYIERYKKHIDGLKEADEKEREIAKFKKYYIDL